MKYFAALLLITIAIHVQANEIRVGFASQDFGNWHFCGEPENHKPMCEEGDELKGFNAEITKALFEKLNLTYSVVFEPWNDNGFLEGLNKNKYDVIISNVGYREARKVYGIYSNQPYESLNALPDYHFFSLRSEQMTLQRVGVAEDSLLHAFLNTLLKPEVIVPYAGPEKLVQGLLDGEVQSIFASFSGYREWICANPEIVKFSSIPTSLNVDGISDDTYILTAKRKPELAKRIDVALKELHDEGTVNRLFDKWIKEKPSCQ